MSEPREIHVVVVERSAEDREDDLRHNKVIQGYYDANEREREHRYDHDSSDDISTSG